MENAVTNIDFSVLTNALAESINATTVLTVMGSVITATMGIFLVTWGGRKIVGAIQSALKSGKIRA